MTLERRRLFCRALHRALEDGTLRYPQLPQMEAKVRRALDDPNAGVEAIAEAVAASPNLAANMLKLANSPIYALKCATLVQAIRLLGIETVRKVGFQFNLGQLFCGRHQHAVAMEIGRKIWTESLQVAAVCREITAAEPLAQEEALLAGMVHRIGVLPVLAMLNRSGKRLGFSAEDIRSILDDEEARLGAKLLAKWGFAASLQSICLNWRRFDGVLQSGDSLENRVVNARYFLLHDHDRDDETEVKDERIVQLRQIACDYSTINGVQQIENDD